MKTLITCVGDTDPIRDFHDGAILHISRVERPDKIILLLSSRTQNKVEEIKKAIFAIASDYTPEIISHPELIENVFLFDDVFEQITTFVDYYLSDEEQYLLNLSSGTPQMKSALFTINRINQYDLQAIQVLTPQRGSNAGVKHDNNEPIDILIEMNEDNQADFEKRLVYDKGENFSISLIRRQLHNLISNYFYSSAYNLLKQTPNYPNRDNIMGELKEISADIKLQRIPDKLKKSVKGHDAQKCVHTFLILKMKEHNEEFAEILIRVKSLGELIGINYIRNNFNRNLIEKNGGYYHFSHQDQVPRHIQGESANIHNLKAFLELQDKREVARLLTAITNINHARNSVAHDMEELTQKNDANKNINENDIRIAIQSTQKFLLATFAIKENSLDFYNKKNDDLISLL